MIALVGLNNHVNHCYMNAIIQALFSIDDFRSYILNYGKSANGAIHTSLSVLFRQMIRVGNEDNSNQMTNNSEDSSSKSVDVHDFRQVFADLKTDFNNFNQQDSQEFLRILVDALHEEVNEAKERKRPTQLFEPKSAREAWLQYRHYMDDSYLVQLFVGQQRSTIRCKRCHHESHRWEVFWDISVPLPDKPDNNISLDECLKAYMSDEILDGESRPTCDKCRKKRKSVKKICIDRCPPILTINLKRFQNDGSKITKEVDFHYDTIRCLCFNGLPYELFVIVSHRGSALKGHYVANVRTNEDWKCCDDECVLQADTNSFKHFAYILFYRMKGLTLKH